MYNNGTEALHNINLTVDKGEFVFIVGSSGAGKSTFLKLVMCEERPNSGQIIVDGVDVTRLPKRKIPYIRRKMGIVFQDFRLIDDESFGVIVCRNAGEEAAALGLLHQGGRAAKRKLQSYAVNVKQYELEKLLAQGAVTCRDGSYFLTNPAFYDPNTGIKLFDDTNYIC